MMVGEKNYALFRAIKQTWDPAGIFNPGKITDTPPMDASLRYKSNQPVRQFKTVLRFSEARGVLRAAEQCNGSGDCRKSHLMGGTMCPSYMATRNERDTTRARANILREVLTNSTKANPFASDEIVPSWISASRARDARRRSFQCRCGPLEGRVAPAAIRRAGRSLRARLIGDFQAMALASVAPEHSICS
jgi:hypothetical protein